MIRYYDTLATYERDGFTIIVEKTYEDTHPRDSFVTDDIDQICKDIPKTKRAGRPIR